MPMASYKVVFLRRAEKELRLISSSHDRKAIESAIDALQVNPRPPGCKKLQGEPNMWRIRVGDFRIIYSIDDAILIVEILRVVNRKDAY
jgi:mRNA interferase RelE/StbE